MRLLSRLPGVAAVVARKEPLPRYDYHCPLLSLPFACATTLETIPADIPYLAAAEADIASWRARLPERPRIGLVWSGERSHDNDLNRSMRLEMLAPLLDLPGIAFVSLQHEVRDEDTASLQSRSDVLVPIASKFKDFADTAAVIASLDAVIAVDTAVAHLAGAMGKPLFLLLPFAADFRWLRERADSPWYPTARLFRQPHFGDWDSVVKTLRQELTQFESRQGRAA